MLPRVPTVFLVTALATMTLGAPTSDVRLQRTEDFPWALYDQIRPVSGSDNIFFSPASLNVALAMVYAGARGATAEAMQKALKWSSDPTTFNTYMKQVHSALTGDASQNLTLESANRVYVDKTAKLKSAYKNTLEDVYGADAEDADFVHDADKERVEINSWVEDKTKGLIKNLFPKGILDASTQAVVVNALYFKAFWALPFDSAKSTKGTFRTYDDKEVEATFMKASESYEMTFSEDLNAVLVRLPYQASDTSFNIILPNRGSTLKEVEAKLNPEVIEDAESRLRKGRSIDLTLPKFAMTKDLTMKDILSKMGLENLFGSKADLTGMIDSVLPVKVDEILHKAHITVDEQGTEAAAATGVKISLLSLPPQVVCDHPFLFYIKRGKQILFVGRMANPSETRSLEPRSDAVSTGLARREEFPWALYSKIRPGLENKNLFFSPASITYVLGMVHKGARNHTRKAIQDALHWTGDARAVHNMMRDLRSALTGSKEQNLTLTSANRIYVDKSVSLKPDYRGTLENSFGVMAEPADFQSNADKETANINNWVANQTNGLIKDLFSPGQLTADTQLVLVNALYFKAFWHNAFDKKETVSGVFKRADNTEVPAQFMSIQDSFGYGYSEALDAHFLRLPYQGFDTSFNLILPGASSSINSLEEKLKLKEIEAVEPQLQQQTTVQVLLPKFELTQRMELKEALTKMGLGDIFANGADFSGITSDSRPLKVDDIVHKAFVSVDEQGTEAAAATGVEFVLFSLPTTVKCDRPFVFYIKRRKHILFVGRLSDPSPA